MHLLLLLRVLRHSLARLSTEGLLGCLRKQALERNGPPFARVTKLFETRYPDDYLTLAIRCDLSQKFFKSCNCTRKHI
ncbi:hypothetical protein C8R45DRAFT_1031124 [Mycena sanguinolenta]|nr:hypothetical protein C8R45DRAFT_1031124 [Mycena sanguinolenta]